MAKYKFIGDAFLLGVKLNTAPMVIEVDKVVASKEKAYQNILFSVKNRFKSYKNNLDFVNTKSLVTLNGQFFFDDEEFDAFELQFESVIKKMAYKSLNDTYVFFEYPGIIEQLYFMYTIDKDIFTYEDFKKAATTPHNVALYYDSYMTCYSLYHFDEQRQVMRNERYPNKWFDYDPENKCFTQFDSVLCIKPIVPK